MISTIILRSSTESVLNDLERAIDDGVNCVKALCKDGRFVAGGGAAEIELARMIKSMGEATPGLDQYAIKKFGEALEIVPKVLADNAGRKSSEVISRLYAAHASGDVNVGVNIEQGEKNMVLDCKKAGVLDLLSCKKSAIRLGSDAAITILRIDQIIMSKAAGGPKPKGP